MTTMLGAMGLGPPQPWGTLDYLWVETSWLLPAMVSAIIAVIVARIALGGKRRKVARNIGPVLWSSLAWGLAASLPARWIADRHSFP